ncbi:MAG TPA: hypothetical protein VF832_05475, partial [Longimicrobiales bacterium]
ALDLSKTGGYTVTVVVSGPAISPSCPQPPAGGFSVPDCSHGGGGGGTLSCSVWCTLAGIFLIAVPISAYISTVAHCLLGPAWNIVLQGGIIATAIGIFLALCGECCLWLFLLIGAALGIIATAIASYWLGFPACWYVALPILIGIIALGIGMAIDCSRKSSSSASGSSSASSSSGLSSALTAWVRGRGQGAGEPLAMSAQPALMMEAEGPAAALTAPALTIQQETAAPGVSTAPMAGLGDLVQQVTKAIGIKPCAPCQQRAARLNELIPFRARDPEAGEA